MRLYSFSALLITSNLLLSSTVLSAAPLCQSALSDPDNDGWGWENNQSCRVSTQTTGSSALCRNGQSDTDGDGWGWENNQSCVVPENSQETNTESSLPVSCISADSDTDNDGWGWENGMSCRVSVPDNETQAEPTATADTPDCSAGFTDSDNDGWGWENNQSCRVVSTEVIPLTIMPVGDSITHGHRSVSSYRKPFEVLLRENDCAFTYVGSQRTNYFFDGYRSPHEGYSGHTADDFLTGNNNAAGDNRGISHSMAAYLPDVVLLHIGSNDMKLGESIDGTVAEIDSMINIIHQQKATTTILLANVVPWYGAPQQSVNSLGTKIEAYVRQLSDSRIRLVDVRSGYSRDMMITDGIHPNAAGEAHIADAFFSVFDNAGLCR